jgi:AcrR family transcriptional regulator
MVTTVTRAATMTGAAARRERNRREMREVILAAARDIVASQGIGALTMRAIAQAIGYSPAAIYEYFPAKEDLYGCLYFEGIGGFAERMRAALAAAPPGASARDRLATLGHAYRAYAHQQPDLFRLVLGNPAPEFTPGFTPEEPEQAEVEAGDDAFTLLVNTAQEGVERGEFVPLPPVTIAMAAWAAVHGFVILELNGHLSAGASGARTSNEPETAACSRDELFAATLDLCASGLLRR